MQRIGPEQLAELDEISKETRKYTIPELKSLYDHYRSEKNLLYKNEG
jgi:hypothetical protein